MQRVMVTGNSGSGKSTFAMELGRRLGLPVVHLDLLHRRADGTRATDDDFREQVRQAASADAWVFEGFNIETFNDRAERADTLILLDLSRWACVRRLLFKPGHRPGVPAGHRLRLADHLDFLRWVWIYPHDRGPGTLAEVRAYEGEKRVIVLRSPREVRRFLRTVPPQR